MFIARTAMKRKSKEARSNSGECKYKLKGVCYCDCGKDGDVHICLLNLDTRQCQWCEKREDK